MTTDIAFPISTTDLRSLRGRDDGVVLTPDDPGYLAEVGTWNSAVRIRPAVVVGARTADDVVRAVRWAADRNLPVGVHATGHSAVPNAEGGVLITTRRMTGVTVDPTAAIATVSAGARVRDIVSAAAPLGLATVQGSSASVGAVGFTTGGGLGPLSRTYGLASDLVRSVDIVTADGRLRTVDGDRDPDLFWAIRGGKGNFGVVTSFRTGLFPLTRVYGGALFYDGVHAREVLQGYRGWVAEHSDATSSSVALLRLPPDPHLPESIRGRFVVSVRMTHVGPAEQGARIVGPARAFAPTLIDSMVEIPVTEIDLVHQDPPGPLPVHERGMLLAGLDEQAVDALLGQAAMSPQYPAVIVEIRRLGGAIAHPAGDPGSVPGRRAPFLVFAMAPDVPPLTDIGPLTVQALFDALRPWRAHGTFLNFLGRSFRPEDVRAAWPAAERARMLRLKSVYDPGNRFRVGHALLSAAH